MNGLVDANDSTTVVARGAAKEPSATTLVPCDGVPCVAMYHVFAELHLSSLCAAPLIVGAVPLFMVVARPERANDLERGATLLVIGSSHVAHNWEARLCLLGGGLLLTRSR